MNYTYIDRCGFLSNCPKILSPNFVERPSGTLISLLVVHFISLPPYKYGGTYVEKLFTNSLDPHDHPYFANISHLRVSSHFLIKRTGEIIQFVSTDKMAFHAGISFFGGREKCNEFSVGIELEGSEIDAFTEQQYKSLSSLTKILKNRYPITDIRGHEHIAPGRKNDPGPFFNWAKYRKDSGCTFREIPQSLENS